jgi:Ca-activated chloride channel family protein
VISRLMFAAAGATAIVVSTVGAQQPAGQQEPTFRAGTRTVPIYASVTDDIGRFVADLRRDDFEVRDDGKVMPITLFTTDVQPLTAIVLLDASRSMVKALDTVVTAADHLAREVNDLFDLRIGPGTRLWDAIGQATTSFEGGEGRRVVIVFTDGDDTSSTSTSDEALAKARRADVMVYAVLIRGMERLPEERRSARRSRLQDASDLAIASGGGYYYVDNVLDDMNSIATVIAEELHSQYVLGFVPQTLDGKLHKLDVRVKRPRLKIRARQSYLAEELGAER